MPKQHKRPTAKVTAGASGGTAATILITLAGQIGVTLPASVAAAIVTVATFAAGYAKREAPR